MKKLASLITVLLCIALAVVVSSAATNGFTPFEQGGFVNGAYYPITVTADGTSGVRLTGKGGLSWPDTANNPIPDAMGAMYDTKIALDGFEFYFRIDTDMEYTGDHWYFIALADQARLFNAWDGSDPVKCGFFMLRFNATTDILEIRPITRMGANTWNDFGGAFIAYEVGQKIVLRLEAVTDAYELYVDDQKITFTNLADIEVTSFDFVSPLSDGMAYMMSGAHVGNPDGPPYDGEYSYTIGIVPEEVVATATPTAQATAAPTDDENPTTGDPAALPVILAGAVAALSLLAARRRAR